MQLLFVTTLTCSQSYQTSQLKCDNLIWFLLWVLCLWCSGLNQSATNFQVFEQGQIAAHRLFAVFCPKPTLDTGNVEGTMIANEVQGNIELRNVYFSYPSRPDVPVLSGLYLSLPARKTLALAGSNGSGKSSIIALIERFYDPTLGWSLPFDLVDLVFNLLLN